MTRTFGFRNWRSYQHYPEGSRNIAWVKFYVALLDDPEAEQLTHAQFGVLSRLLLLAARTSNRMLDDTSWLSRKLGRVTRRDLDALAHFLVEMAEPASTSASEPASKAASTLATTPASKAASPHALARGEERRPEKNTQRARAPEPPADPLPEPCVPPELHVDPIPLDKRQTSADSAETAEHEILNLPVDAIAPLQNLLDARARCLVAASHRGGMPPYMPGSPASALPWTSQWVPAGRAIADMVSDFGLDDFTAGCEAVVKSQFNIAANPMTFVRTVRTKCEQARDSAAARAELGPPEGERGEQTYCDPSRHVNLSVVRDNDA